MPELKPFFITPLNQLSIGSWNPSSASVDVIFHTSPHYFFTVCVIFTVKPPWPPHLFTNKYIFIQLCHSFFTPLLNDGKWPPLWPRLAIADFKRGNCHFLTQKSCFSVLFTVFFIKFTPDHSGHSGHGYLFI